MLKHFRIFPFILGVIFAALFFKNYKMETLSIFQYPHPNNIHERVYKDKNGVCYAYTAEEVNCNSNESTLTPYPLQG
uniref:Uncharacterized protein n=1 Tax=viral metagenome TaxID=1070528 RepID=A0A6C0JYP8_9ZZZZ